jgi:hypothetical protein
VQPKLVLNLLPICLSLLSAEITGMDHYAQQCRSKRKGKVHGPGWRRRSFLEKGTLGLGKGAVSSTTRSLGPVTPGDGGGSSEEGKMLNVSHGNPSICTPWASKRRPCGKKVRPRLALISNTASRKQGQP